MRRQLWIAYTACGLALMVSTSVRAADYPPPTQGDYVIHDFHFHNGATLPELKIHYRTVGKPQRDDKGVVRNAVLIIHGTTGSGKQFDVEGFAGELFGKGQLLDAEKYYVIMPDDIGHGQSSKPSDGLHAKFPNYRYADMIDAEYKLVTDGLEVNHLRLVMGTSMGGMHTWLWGEAYPDFMDALCRWPACRSKFPAATACGGNWQAMRFASIRSGKMANTPVNRGDYIYWPK